VKRREFITLLGGAAAAWPLVARAQQPDQMRRVGVLMTFPENDPETQLRLATFVQALQELGWVEHRNVRIDYRWAPGGKDRLRTAAQELFELRPDVIVGVTTPAVAALQEGSHTIPIVFVQVSAPIESGFVTSFARPGGNITGFTNIESSIAGKWVELLKEVAPRIMRVAVMFNPNTAPVGGSFFLPWFEAAAKSFSMEWVAAAVHDATEIESSLAALGREPGSGLIVMADVTTTVHRKLIVSMATRHRLPAVYPFRYFAADGGLISYGPEVIDMFRRAASYVNRILKGAKPADLPVQAPTKFELVINLKAARALGLDVPWFLQQRADEVIE
jgi:putative ABC transport system substrate-binding protein